MSTTALSSSLTCHRGRSTTGPQRRSPAQPCMTTPTSPGHRLACGLCPEATAQLIDDDSISPCPPLPGAGGSVREGSSGSRKPASRFVPHAKQFRWTSNTALAATSPMSRKGPSRRPWHSQGHVVPASGFTGPPGQSGSPRGSIPRRQAALWPRLSGRGAGEHAPRRTSAWHTVHRTQAPALVITRAPNCWAAGGGAPATARSSRPRSPTRTCSSTQRAAQLMGPPQGSDRSGLLRPASVWLGTRKLMWSRHVPRAFSLAGPLAIWAGRDLGWTH